MNILNDSLQALEITCDQQTFIVGTIHNMSSRFNKNCREGNKCPNGKCAFVHPSTWTPPEKKPMNEIDCRNGSKCTNNTCGFKHPAARVLAPPEKKPMNEIDCREGDKCPNGKCGFKHPSTRVITPPKTQTAMAETNCRYGDKCTNASCGFKHSSARALAPPKVNSECLAGKLSGMSIAGTKQ